MSYLLTDSPPPLKRLKVSSLVGGSGGKSVEFLSPGKKKKLKGKGGSSCHQCKSRRNFTALTYCTSNLDKKNKKCRKKFCGHCLKKFYKETPQGISDRTTWRCPSCRKICCCAACRRRKQRDSGFSIPPSASKPKSTFKKPLPMDPHHMEPMDHPDLDLLERMERMERMEPHTMDEHALNYNHVSNNSIQHGPPHGHDRTNQYSNMPAGLAVPPDSHPSRPDDLDSYSFRNEPFQLPTFSPMITPTTDISSPMPTPLHVPMQFGDFPGMSHELLQPLDSAVDLQRVPASEYPALLAREIRKQAKQASQDQNNSQFAHLYSIAQAPRVRKKIQLILARTDISQDQKVECIAQILRHHGSTLSSQVLN